MQDLREQLAAIEHQRWADWQEYLHSLCVKLTEEADGEEGKSVASGALAIPAPLVRRWERQINTPYEQLSEAERRSDMEQVDRYWPLLEPYLYVGILACESLTPEDIAQLVQLVRTHGMDEVKQHLAEVE